MLHSVYIVLFVITTNSSLIFFNNHYYRYSAYISLVQYKFSQIAVLNEFVEKNSRMRVAHARGSAGAQILAE